MNYLVDTVFDVGLYKINEIYTKIVWSNKI